MSECEIGVLGAGAWGTALAVLWAREGRRVALWGRDPAQVAALRASRETARLPGIKIPETVDIVDRFPKAAALVAAVPMQHLRAVLTALPASSAPLILCCKGLEVGSLLLPPELVGAVLPDRDVAVLTGPNFAHEIAGFLPAAAVLAAEDGNLRAHLMAMMRGRTLRLYGSADVLGASLGGAAKNVIAIAAGVVIGAGLGENARAALITRGIAEIARLATALGGRAETVSGLSGLGDLLLTCTGEKSRNYSLGLALGRGEGLAEILAGRTGVTEGVGTAPALAMRAAAAAVEMPIVTAVDGLLSGRSVMAEMMAGLMGRALRDE